MRKLKFRVWDLYEKKYYYHDKGYQGHYVLSLDGEFTNLHNGVGGREVVVEQSTGLIDKNKTAIFEGDIVKIHDEQLAKVVWEAGAFAAILLAPEGTMDLHWLYRLYTPKDVEVMGSYYEIKQKNSGVVA